MSRPLQFPTVFLRTHKAFFINLFFAVYNYDPYGENYYCAKAHIGAGNAVPECRCAQLSKHIKQYFEHQRID